MSEPQTEPLELAELPWTALTAIEKRDLVKHYADKHMSAGQIARTLNVSRNAVVGVVHRNRQHITLSGGTGWGLAPRRKRPRPAPRHTNEPKIARLGPPPSTTRTSANALEKVMRGPAWTPLPGSTPTNLMGRDKHGCAWPVHDPAHPGATLFCNCAVDPASKLPYCPAHLARYGRLK